MNDIDFLKYLVETDEYLVFSRFHVHLATDVSKAAALLQPQMS